MGRLPLKNGIGGRFGFSPHSMHRLWPAANKNPGLNRPTGQNMQRGARTLDAKMAEGGKAQNEK